MSDLVVETRGLRKVFRDLGRKVAAVDGLDLAVERGGVHGFLGPNGSGKTTTIRMLLGLATADAGEIRVLGEPLPGRLPAVLDRVGAVVEQPHFTPDLSGRRNLQLLARAAGLPKSRADEVLAQVGLTEGARGRFRRYSFGMKQRLGLAAALLKKPELLILDEPMNGLDPAGTTDMRELILDLAASGVTVLLSSHVLAEVQQVCSSVSIIGEGRMLASGKVDDLLGEDTSHTRVGVADPAKATEVLTASGYAVARDGDDLLVQGHEHPEEITRALAAKDLYVTELSAVRPDLESFFLVLTGHRPRPEAPADGPGDLAGSGTRTPEDRGMIRLVRVELTRYRSRRMIALLLLLAAVLAALVAVKSAWDTRPITAQEVATAKKDAALAAQRSDIRADLSHCLADPQAYLGTNATPQDCRDNLTAGPRSFLPREPLDLHGTLKGNGLGVALAVAGLLVIAASTFAGSDWGSGSVVTQLLFEPRRTRMWVAKGLAVAIASAVVALVTIGGFWLAMYLIAAQRDVPHGSDVMSDVGWHLLRAVTFAIGASVGAFALTMLFRHAVATLSLLFVLSVGGEVLTYLLPVDNVGRWTLGNNVYGWLETRMEFFDPTSRCARLGDCDRLAHIGHLQGGVYLLGLLVLTVVLSVLLFRRRDVAAV